MTTVSLACRLALAGAALALAAGLQAAPVVPAGDDEIVETLPTLGALAAEQRKLKRQLAVQPKDAETVLALSRAIYARAQHDGDARFAGQALGVLRAWDGDAKAPIEIRLQRATLLQHLHEFDTAARELDGLLADAPLHAQALLTLATIRRVQGRYAESDALCERLAGAGQPQYGSACLAENQALRGRFDAARQRLQGLIAEQAGNAGWEAWVRTTLGELEARAGRADAGIAELQRAVALDATDAYARLALVDALLEAGQAERAEPLLAKAGDGDAALLRRALVAKLLRRPDADALRRTLAERYAQAGLRPEAVNLHARERAWFALDVEGDAPRALRLARANIQTQREPIDLLLMDRAARAAGDAQARAEVAALAQRIGLRDVRLGGAPAKAPSS